MQTGTTGDLGDQGQPTNDDLESGPANETRPTPIDPNESTSKPLTSTKSIVGSAFTQLFKNAEQRGEHVDFSNKPEVYRKLMNCLDDVDQIHWKFNSTLIAIELLVFSGLLSALICSLTMNRLKHHRILRLRIWRYLTMAMMLASGLSVIRFLTAVVFYPVKRIFRIHKYVVYFTRQLKSCLDVTLWFCIVFLGWYLWFRPRLKHVHGDVSVIVSHQVTRFLIALCLGSFLWLLKNILYLKLEADLHYNQLFNRIQLSVIYLHGLQIIHKRAMWKFLTDSKNKKKLKEMEKEKEENKEEMEKEKEEKEEEIKNILMKGDNIWMEVKAMEKETVPIWILRRLEEEYLEEVKLNPLPGNRDLTKDDQKILKEAKRMFRQLININKNKGVADHTDLRSESFSQLNRKRIHVADPDHFSDHEIKRDDLKEYGLSDDELDFIFKLTIQGEEDDNDELDDESKKQATNSEDKSISYDEFLNWAVRAYKNCWGLEQTLYSSKRVFIKLNRLMSTFLLMVVLIIWLLLSKIVNTGQLALLFTPFLAASFIFGDSSKKMFEGLIFVFAMHPFDVGDRVIINNAQMRVTKMNILTSVFYKYDTGEEVIFPNSVLTTTSIINLDITPDQSDKIEFTIPAKTTSLEETKDLEIKIKKWLDDDIEYSSNNKVVKSDITNEDMKMTIYFKYLVSYLTSETKAVHKSKILSMIMRYRKNMETNKKEFSSSYQPYSVVIHLRKAIKLKDIEELQDEIMSGLEPRYSPYSNVLIVELTKSRIEMDLYVGHPPYSGREDGSEDDTLRMKFMKKIFKDKEKKNLEDISERLKRVKFVKGVIISEPTNVNNGDDEVIAQGGLGWGIFQDVIQTLDSPKRPLEKNQKIDSGGVEEEKKVVVKSLFAREIIAAAAQSHDQSPTT